MKYFKLILLTLFLIIIKPVQAVSVINNEFCSLNNYSIKIDQETIKSGYTISAFDDFFKIGIFPNVFSLATRIDLKNITKLNKDISDSNYDLLLDYKNFPDGWELNSDIYEYNLDNKMAYDQSQNLVVEIGFGKDSDNYKKMFYFDDQAKEWKKLLSETDWVEKKVRAKLSFNFVKLAVFDQKDILSRGKASWYNQSLFRYFNYKNGDYAASQQYPKGTKLKVTNLSNGKSVIIEVNDYGPEKWTGRIIDLDVSAFKQLASKSLGWINVVVDQVE